MFHKNLKTAFVTLLLTSLLFAGIKHAAAATILTVYTDSVKKYNDTITYCPGYDSIKFIPPAGVINVILWRYNGDTLMDSNILILPGNFTGFISCQYFDTKDFTMLPLQISGTNKSIKCGDSVVLDSKINYKGNGSLTYNWSPTTGLNNPQSSNPTAKITQDIKYTASITTPDACTLSMDILVSLLPINKPDICFVGIDSTNKNVITWDNPASFGIDSFYIYKETYIADSYQKIGAVAYNNYNYFRDSSSNPDVHTNKYKISVKDKCGFESNKSNPHKTMHLTINKGIADLWNLIWERYEGFNYSSLCIYRGSSKDSLTKIAEIANNISTFTDIKSISGTVYYQIEVIKPDTCIKAAIKSANNISIRSNIVNTDMLTTNSSSDGIYNIWPNPTTGVVNIVGDNILHSDIFDITGRIQGTYYGKIIDLSNLSAGIYFIRVNSAILKLVKQ